MNPAPSPKRKWLRAAAAAGGLLALAAVGWAADRQRPPGAAPVASASALVAPAGSPVSAPAASSAPPPAGSVGAPGEAAEAPPAGVLPDGRVVLNLATEDDLRKLPGIGPTRARAIVALRQRQGKLRAVADLLRVKGIGRKTLAKLLPKMVLDPPRT